MIKKRIYLNILVLMLVFTVQFCNGTEPVKELPLDKQKLVKGWEQMMNRDGKPVEGKLIYAKPPHMMVVYLHSGEEKRIPGIVTEGGPGRRRRGLTPRPFWSPDGKLFIYRYQNRIYLSDEAGNRRELVNDKMNRGKESRWSLVRYQSEEWAVGPSKSGGVIMVNLADQNKVLTAYAGDDVDYWCEMTGDASYVVYDNGGDVYVTKSFSGERGIKISDGQSCRPAASPDGRVAWLPAPHVKYQIYRGEDGRFLSNLNAPPNEEIYRLNWSNLPDVAVHMFGSRGDTKINIRRVSDGKHLFAGYGWDPDLWIGGVAK